MHAKERRTATILCLAAVLMAGCGGGSGGTSHSPATSPTPVPTPQPASGLTASIVNTSTIAISVKLLKYEAGKGAVISFSAPCVDVDSDRTGALYADPDTGSYALVMTGYACYERTLGSMAYASSISGEQLEIKYTKGPLLDLGSFEFNGTTLRQMRPVSSAAPSSSADPSSEVVSGTPAPGDVVSWTSTGYERVPRVSGVTAIAANLYTWVALRRDGTVVGWGEAKDVPPDLAGVVSIAAGAGFALAVKSDGTVVAWGREDRSGEQQVPASLADVKQVAAGYGFGLALKKDGTVVGWGGGDIGVPNQINYREATAAQKLQGVVAISAFAYHCLALKSDGTVVAWGWVSDRTLAKDDPTRVPEGLGNVKAIAAGQGFSVALKSDGTVVAWGSNGHGQITVPAGLTDVVAITGGPEFAAAVRSDGTVVAWGTMDVYQPSPMPAVAPEGLPRLRALGASNQDFIGLVK